MLSINEIDWTKEFSNLARIKTAKFDLRDSDDEERKSIKAYTNMGRRMEAQENIEFN